MAHPVPAAGSRRDEFVSQLYQEVVTKNELNKKGHLTDFTKAQLDEFIGPSPVSALSGMTLSVAGPEGGLAGGCVLCAAGDGPRSL